MSLYREWLTAHGILGSKELSQAGHGRRVRAAGLLVVHQSPPTAKGFHFLTLENQDELMNVIVALGVCGRYRSVIRGVANLLAERLAPLPGLGT